MVLKDMIVSFSNFRIKRVAPKLNFGPQAQPYVFILNKIWNVASDQKFQMMVFHGPSTLVHLGIEFKLYSFHKFTSTVHEIGMYVYVIPYA